MSEKAVYITYMYDPADVQVNWGTCADPRGVLTVGEEYEVERIDVHSWHTKIFLKGIDSGRGFNDVSFEYEDYADKEAAMERSRNNKYGIGEVL